MRQAADRDRSGEIREHTADVFTIRTGKPIEPRNLYRSFTRVAMNVYTHVVQDTQRKAVNHMDRLLRRRPRS